MNFANVRNIICLRSANVSRIRHEGRKNRVVSASERCGFLNSICQRRHKTRDREVYQIKLTSYVETSNPLSLPDAGPWVGGRLARSSPLGVPTTGPEDAQKHKKQQNSTTTCESDTKPAQRVTVYFLLLLSPNKTH